MLEASVPDASADKQDKIWRCVAHLTCKGLLMKMRRVLMIQ